MKNNQKTSISKCNFLNEVNELLSSCLDFDHLVAGMTVSINQTVRCGSDKVKSAFKGLAA